jgi:hypothetical protein
MSDEADAADLTAEQHLKDALTRRRASLPAVGQCYSCAEPAEGGARFCNKDCLDDYERAEKARRMNGRSE